MKGINLALAFVIMALHGINAVNIQSNSLVTKNPVDQTLQL